MMRIPIFIAAAMLALASVAALQEATVQPGESLTVQVDSGARGTFSEIEATYRIASVGFFHQTKLTHPDSPIVTEDLRFDLPPGTYRLTIDLLVDQGQRHQEELLVHVGAAPSTRTTTTPGTTKPSTAPGVPAAPVLPATIITVPAIPDVEPGTSLVLPVTITGNGVYQLTVPKLPFATYEAPGPVRVEGELTIPILLHIDADAKAGLYVIPISAGNETASVRVRVIRYVEHDTPWLVIAGIILIVIGLLLLFVHHTRQRPEEPRAPREPTQTDSGELITYY